MGDSDDENFATFGSALEPLDEENLPRKKAITIEEQYALDPQGRRRFHGAFTGGFSAGYFNSVGTRDGWRPQQFKSSRSSKADGISQRPEDFMDEEDTGEFGIAPTAIRANSDFTDHGRRGTKRERLRQDNDGPIPGVPVLRELLKPVKDTVGMTLLKKMGWRPGQGIGPRLTKSEKVRTRRKNEKLKVYGCSLPNQAETGDSGDSGSEISDDQGDVVLFAPDDYEPFVCNPKENYFGIGYSGLDRRPVLSHVNLFDEPSAFKLSDNNKKLSIRGQAFGVGAFEADDEDIYQRDDMSRYDFSLGPAEPLKSEKTRSRGGDERSATKSVIDGFVRATRQQEEKKIFEPPQLPTDFKPVHAIRKSRFYPPIEATRVNADGRRANQPNLTANDRAKILDDSGAEKNSLIVNKTDKSSVANNIITRTLNLQGRDKMAGREIVETPKAASWLDKLNSTNFVSGGVEGISEKTGSLKKLEDFENSQASRGSFRPFPLDPDKQTRFEKFLASGKSIERLSSLQPLSMTEWEREHERDEFVRAARMCEEARLPEVMDEPSREVIQVSSKDSTMGGKFVEGGAGKMALQPEVMSNEERMKNAARMRLFGKLTRERDAWQPASIVCKRFNIPEPRSGCPVTVKQSKKYSVFDSLEFCENSRTEDTGSAEKFKQATVSRANRRVDEPAILSSTLRWTPPCPQTTTPSCLDISDIDASLSKSNAKIPSFEASYEKIFGNSTTGSSSTGTKEDQDKMASGKERENSNAADKETIAKEVERKDLFKAIFLSSSEDSESDNGDHEDDSEAVKSLLIGKKPGDFNLQRNTSPPRGIFAKLDLDDLAKPPKVIDRLSREGAATNEKKINDEKCGEKNCVDKAATPEVELSTDMYGPVLPKKMPRDVDKSSACEDAGSSKELEFSRPIFRSVVVTRKESAVTDRVKGEWVERVRAKKSKRDKHKHKHKEKERSRHKRKSKKSKR